LESSKSYKIDTKIVTGRDELVVNIDHESQSFQKTYRFRGSDIADKKSISFRVTDFGTHIDIRWSGATPTGAGANQNTKNDRQHTVNVADPKTQKTDLKTSFDPVSNNETRVLILGTMPGDKSIALGEYYGHPRNRFWKIIAQITNNEMPTSYQDKKQLLLKTAIGVWDVAHKAIRKGSLDSNILEEEPNDIHGFVAAHKNLKIIAFNGTKSETLYDKYFDRYQGISYLSLPSTSPANTTISYDLMQEKWHQLMTEKD
jgi:hypoxanthine-DNA glycosylase